MGSWDTALSDGTMQGRWAHRFDFLQTAVTEYMENELLTMKHISNAALAARGETVN